MPIPDTEILDAEIVVEGRMASGGGDNVQTINVFTYHRNATAVAAQKDDLATVFSSSVLSPMKDCLNARWQASRVRVRWLNDAEDPYEDFPSAVLGTQAGDSLPSDKCAYFILRSGRRGKKFRGAKFLGPVSETDTTANHDIFNAAAQTRLNTFGTAMVASMTDATTNVWKPTVVSRAALPPTSQLKTNPTTLVYATVESVILNRAVRSLRRRRISSIY